MTKKEDVIVLCYFDCVIRQSDLIILKGNGWLNDAIIGFYFTFLEKERFQSRDDLLFVGPEVTHCLKESPSCDMPIFLDPLEAKKKNFLFFAVNDSGKSSGGSHWSLLVFSCFKNKFFHFDSSSQTNSEPALKLACNICRYFSPSAEIDFHELISLQQDNSYDCGTYLICNLENIVDHIVKGEVDLELVPLITRDIVKSRRSNLVDLIAEREKQSK